MKIELVIDDWEIPVIKPGCLMRSIEDGDIVVYIDEIEDSPDGDESKWFSGCLIYEPDKKIQIPHVSGFRLSAFKPLPAGSKIILTQE